MIKEFLGCHHLPKTWNLLHFIGKKKNVTLTLFTHSAQHKTLEYLTGAIIHTTDTKQLEKHLEIIFANL